MKKYSKEKMKMKRWVKIVIFLLLVVVLLIGAFLLFVGLKNHIVKENIDATAKDVSNDVAQNASPIVINNVIAGGIYDKKWVSSEKYFLNSKNKAETELDIYNKDGKAGTYILRDLKQEATSIYAFTTNLNIKDEFIAVGKNTTNLMPNPAHQSNIQDEDYDFAKKALGIYRLFNTSIKVTSAYDITLQDGEPARILFVTNQTGKSVGAYSAVVFVDLYGNVKLIKYSYVRDLKNADDWAIYSLMFVIDLNHDAVAEIVLQETKEFDVKYSIMEYKNNQFTEVLSTEFKI